VAVTTYRPGVAGLLRLDAPSGWQVAPAAHPFRFSATGQSARFTFTVTAPVQPAAGQFAARAEVGGTVSASERIEIRYPHVPAIVLQPAAQFKAVGLDLAIRGQQIGYLPGAGDGVLEGLQQMGYAVTLLTEADLTAERLHPFATVVVGIRAFNVRTELAAKLPALFAYVEGGGTVVMQYNTANGLQNTRLAPYDLHLSSDRVTDENAPVTFLAPNHPVLNVPNKITEADFTGWVQERGIYFPNQWDEHFTPILACGDPGEAPLKGGLLVANYGKGYFVYTGLVFFRQLPAGVPGAYRLFANLVSLGK
jgi:hypothetical protein